MWASSRSFKVAGIIGFSCAYTLIDTGNYVAKKFTICRHTICAVMTAEFLAYSKYVGNDLTTARPEWNFPGLKAGEQWCVVAARFLQAHDEGCAPKVRLEATHIRALEVVPLEILEKYAI